MKIGTEIVIGVVIGVVMTIGLVVGGFFGLVFLVEQGQKEHARKVEQAEVDGREFGKTTDQNACMEKGFLRDATKDSFYMSVAFVEECLKSSKPIPDFCDGVPLGYDPGKGKDISKWLDERCKKVGHNNRDSCGYAFNAKRSFCRTSNGDKSK